MARYKRYSLFFLFLFIACDRILVQAPVTTDGVKCGVTEGPFKGFWYDYYERALSFADCGLWTRAELDLRRAIDEYDSDKRNARIYGDHLMDYFPHGELGVVLFEQGRLEESVRELETSLKMVTTAKAQMYLNKARKALIEKRRKQKDPPIIQIESPVPSLVTRDFSVEVRGRVIDGNDYVRHIAVNNRPFRMYVSTREQPFGMKVPVRPGKNEITITAANLMGDVSEKKMAIFVDRFGPIFSIDEIVSKGQGAESSIEVRGYAYDASGIAGIVVNGKNIVIPDKPTEFFFREHLPANDEVGALRVTVTDVPGNETKAEIPLNAHARGSRSGVLLAFNSSSSHTLPPVDIAADFNARTDARYRFAENQTQSEYQGHPHVKIELHDKATERRTYLNEVVIDGVIKSNDHPVTLYIEGEEILRTQPGERRSSYYFGSRFKLREGRQSVMIEAEGSSGISDIKTIHIDKYTAGVWNRDSRLSMAVNEFKRRSGKNVERISFGFEDILEGVLFENQPKRFSKVELLEKAKNPKTIAKSKGFDCVLSGRIHERNVVKKNSITITAEIANLDGEIIVGAKDVYAQDVNNNNIESELRKLSELLHNKLVGELPMISGSVLAKTKNRVTVDLGEEKEIRKGMKIIVYQQDENKDEDSIWLGEAKVEKVKPEVSIASLSENSKNESIQPMHRVITK